MEVYLLNFFLQKKGLIIQFYRIYNSIYLYIDHICWVKFVITPYTLLKLWI